MAVTLVAATDRLAGSRGAAGDALISVDLRSMTGFSDVLTLTGLSSNVPRTILAGNGNDRLTMGGTQAVLIDLGGGRDAIDGTFTGGEVTGEAGNDTVALAHVGVSSGDITVSGGSGDDRITVSSYGRNQVTGGDGVDVITVDGVGLGNATISGGSGDDVITGLGTLFQVDAGTGNDKINLTVVNTSGSLVSVQAGDGDDAISVTLTGTEGNEALGLFNGGAGDDHFILVDAAANGLHSTYQVDAAWGHDSVTGFVDGQDRIEFRATGALEFGHLGVAGDATHTVITYGTDSIRIVGLDAALFTFDDVPFT